MHRSAAVDRSAILRPGGMSCCGPCSVSASPESWPYLDAALQEAAGGDSGSLYEMIDSMKGRTPTHPDVDTDDALFVIGCNDSASGPPAEQMRSEAVRLAQTYPRFGEFGAWWLFSCTYWTTPHPVLPVPESTTAAPVLVVGTQGDPVTPYSGAVALVQAIGPSATLLTASGGGHSAFGRWPCVGDHVTRYLIEVRVPEGQARRRHHRIDAGIPSSSRRWPAATGTSPCSTNGTCRGCWCG